MKSIITKLTIILALLVGVSITNPIPAEAATGRGYRTSYEPVTPSRNSVGFVAGSTYGFGIGYKHQFYNSPVALQLAGFPFITEDDVLLTGGVVLQFTLHRGNYGSTFISVGSSVMHEANRWVSQYDKTMVAVGPGIGIEWMAHKNFGVVLDIPAAAFFDTREGFKSILPIPNLTLMYTW